MNKNHSVTLIGTEKALDKIQYSIIIFKNSHIRCRRNGSKTYEGFI